MMQKKLLALMLGLLLVAGVAFGGAQQEAAEEGTTPAEQVGVDVDLSQKEAPMLEEMVEAGELPPLEDRLPLDPLVVEPFREPGKYGGEMKQYMIGVDRSMIVRSVNYEKGTRWPWNADFSVVLDNVFENITPSQNDTVFTVDMREGMKWSDGEPFTAEDVKFQWDAWYNYEDEYWGGKTRRQFVVNGEMPEIEVIDEYTFRLTFGGPYGIFPQLIAHGGGWAEFWFPKHYLEQFHPLYVGQEEAQRVAEENGFETWIDCYKFMRNARKNTERPVLYPYIMRQSGDEGIRFIYERNPYYWKVDTEGRQLPYIDRVVFDIYQTVDSAIINLMNGDYDMGSKGTTLENYPLFVENQDKGDYRLIDVKDEKMNMAIINFNMNHPEPAMRELFNTPAFKKGVSHAINRTEISELIYRGTATPMQASPRPESPFHHEEYANAYLEYDPDRANQFLDEAGLTERDSDGFRLNQDGSQLSIVIESSPNYRPEYPDLLELLKKYLRAVDLRVDYKIHGNITDMSHRQQAGQHDAMLWHGDGGMTVLFEARYYIPSISGWSSWAPKWADWYTSDGRQGEEPPQYMKDMMNKYDRVQQTSNLDEQRALMQDILDQHYENMFVIGTVLGGPSYQVVSNRLQNVPPWWWSSWPYPDPAPINYEQLWLAE
jgi:peptide/nickel transport system substrate-binding protein